MAEYRDEEMPKEYQLQEERLSQAGESYRDMAVPETISLYIERGIQQGKRRARIRYARRFSGWTAAAVLIMFMLSVRVSPTFAQAVSQIPGMDVIVKLVHFDKGLMLAVENDFIQPVGAYDEHDGVRLTVDGVIADEHRMVILYNLHSMDDAGLKITGVKLIDPASDEPIGVGYSTALESQGTIDVWLDEEAPITDQMTLEMGISIYPVATNEGVPLISIDEQTIPSRWNDAYPKPDGVWSVTFDLDHDQFNGLAKVFDIQQSVTVDGQKFTVKRAVVHPIGVTVDIEIDPYNSKEIFSFSDLKLMNEKGEKYGHYLAILGEEQTIYFESPYFSMPEKLFLEGELIKALDKDQLEIEVDLVNKKIVRAPDDQVEIDKVNEREDHMDLFFTIRQPEFDETFYQIFGYEYRDEGGNIYDLEHRLSAYRVSDEPFTRNDIVIRKLDYVGNLFFKLSSYPSFIEEPFRIQIK